MSDIFVSYSRKNKRRAIKIVRELESNGYDVWIDLDDIPKGVDWQQEIDHNIEKAETFLFLISPHSVTSEPCKREIDYANGSKNKKRIIPVVLQDTETNRISNIISKLNWIFCRSGKDDFENAINEIREDIHTDNEWIKYHTSLLTKAIEWESDWMEPSNWRKSQLLSLSSYTTKRDTCNKFNTQY